MRKNQKLVLGAVIALALAGCEPLTSQPQAPEVTATINPTRLPFQGGEVQVTAQANSRTASQVQLTLSLIDDEGESAARRELPVGTQRWSGTLTVPATSDESGCTWSLQAAAVDGYGLNQVAEITLIQDGFVAPVGDAVPVGDSEASEENGNVGTEQPGDGQPPVPVFSLP